MEKTAWAKTLGTGAGKWGGAWQRPSQTAVQAGAGGVLGPSWGPHLTQVWGVGSRPAGNPQLGCQGHATPGGRAWLP